MGGGGGGSVVGGGSVAMLPSPLPAGSSMGPGFASRRTESVTLAPAPVQPSAAASSALSPTGGDAGMGAAPAKASASRVPVGAQAALQSAGDASPTSA
jgi:hypothetical protein